jgi:SAM-dependent methyltransferase
VTRALKGLGNTVTVVERDGRFEETLQDIADSVVITDLEWLDLRQKLVGQKFDVVLAGDVLEHCSRPELVLLQFHDLLTPDGYLVISLPNIAHADVRLALLTGKFNYRPTGLLDRTHLRFFTRETITTFLEDNDFDVAQVFASTAAIGTTEFGPPPSTVPAEAISFVQSDRDATVYQYIVKAVPRALANRAPDPVLTTEVEGEQHLLGKLSLYEEYVNRMTWWSSGGHHAELEAARAQLREQTVALLEARDHAIGVSAELGVLRHRVKTTQDQIDSLVHQLNVIHQSRTWRIGRFMLLPLRILRKIVRVVIR